jgi:hypothetical protein
MQGQAHDREEDAMHWWYFVVAAVVLGPVALIAYLVWSIHRGDNE